MAGLSYAAASSIRHCTLPFRANSSNLPFRKWKVAQTTNPRLGLVTTCSLKARWQLDARFGRKKEAVNLLKDWVKDIGSEAGLTNSNTSLTSGAVGAPESRLILEVEMDDMASLEAFWSRIPSKKHETWCRTIQDMIVDGSPQWEVYRQIPISIADDKEAFTSGSGLTIIDDMDEAASIIGQDFSFETNDDDDVDLMANLEISDSGFAIVENMEDIDRILGTGSGESSGGPSADEIKVQKPKPGSSKFPLDWKGDPMKINPGDKFPRFQ